MCWSRAANALLDELAAAAPTKLSCTDDDADEEKDEEEEWEREEGEEEEKKAEKVEKRGEW